MDLYVEVRSIDTSELSNKPTGEHSRSIRERVTRARALQEERSGNGYPCLNSHMTPAQIEDLCILDDKSISLLKKAAESFSLTARGYHRVLKVARTIADLDVSEHIKTGHLAEALQYRPSIDSEF